MDKNSNVLVFGGSGFVGSHLVEALVDFEVAQIINFDIRNNDIFETDPRLKEYVTFVNGSISQLDQVQEAITKYNIDTIIHCATPPPFVGDKILKEVNIQGTEVLFQAIKNTSCVKRLILVSSSSVVYEGGDVIKADESIPYAKNAYNTYTSSKIQQEQMVLKFNGICGVKTVAVRPAAIFGPRDTLFFPSVIEVANRGGLRVCVGNGKNLYSFTYVKNVCQGIMLAAQNINKDNVAGQVFFLTNDDDIPFWDLMGDIAERLNKPKPRFCVPRWLYWCICAIVAVVVWIVNHTIAELLFKRQIEIPVSLSFDKLSYLTSTRTFSCEKAKKHLHYKPIPMKQAMDETFAALNIESKKSK